MYKRSTNIDKRCCIGDQSEIIIVIHEMALLHTGSGDRGVLGLGVFLLQNPLLC